MSCLENVRFAWLLVACIKKLAILEMVLYQVNVIILSWSYVLMLNIVQISYGCAFNLSDSFDGVLLQMRGFRNFHF